MPSRHAIRAVSGACRLRALVAAAHAAVSSVTHAAKPAGQAAPDPIPPTQQQQPEDRPAPGRPPQSQPGAQSSATQPQQDAARTLTGTIVKNGDQLVLTTQDNVNFQLDDQERAKRFVGTQVKVTGVVDSSSHKIHVEKIEPVV